MIRKRSVKTEKIYAQHRRPLVAKLLAKYPVCQRCNNNYSQDVHELKTRARGGSILDENNLRCVCRTCHNWITGHPQEAHEQGWLKWSWE